MPEKITLFEPHFHDAQFGPTVTTEKSAEDEQAGGTDESTPSRSGGRLRYLLVAAAIAAVGYAVYRRVTGEEPFEIEVEEYETEEATASQ